MLQTKTNTAKFSKTYVALLVVCAAALYGIVPQISKFHKSFEALTHADVTYLLLAGVSICAAVLTSALAYQQLLPKKPKILYRDLAILQTAGMFINRLLPAGLGGLGLMTDFLYGKGYTLPRATTIATLNNLLTSLGHVTLLLVAIIGFGVSAPSVSVSMHPAYIYAFAGLFLVAVGLYAAQKHSRIKIINTFTHGIVGTLVSYKSHKLRLFRAYLVAMLNTCCHMTALALTIQAFHVSVPLAAPLLILTAGVALSSFTPTPGGVVGYEAGLTAALIGYNVAASDALAIALTYRFVTYWLPLIPGAVAFFVAQRRQLI